MMTGLEDFQESWASILAVCRDFATSRPPQSSIDPSFAYHPVCSSKTTRPSMLHQRSKDPYHSSYSTPNLHRHPSRSPLLSAARRANLNPCSEEVYKRGRHATTSKEYDGRVSGTKNLRIYATSATSFSNVEFTGHDETVQVWSANRDMSRWV